MVSLYVESLFFDIPLEEIIDNIINDLFLKTDKVHDFSREQLFTFEVYLHIMANYKSFIKAMPLKSTEAFKPFEIFKG